MISLFCFYKLFRYIQTPLALTVVQPLENIIFEKHLENGVKSPLVWLAYKEQCRSRISVKAYPPTIKNYLKRTLEHEQSPKSKPKHDLLNNPKNITQPCTSTLYL